MSSLSPTITAILILGVCTTNSVILLCTELAKDDNGDLSFEPSQIVFATELLKFMISVGFTIHGKLELGGIGAVRSSLDLRNSLMYFVPSLLHAIASNTNLVILSNLGNPVTFQVFRCLEIPIIGILSVSVLGRKLTRVQWLALILLTNSIIQTELSVNNSRYGDPDDEGYIWSAALWTMFSAGLSGLAGIFLEYSMKSSQQANVEIWEQIAHVCLWSSLINGVLFKYYMKSEDSMFAVFEIGNFFGSLLVPLHAFLGLVTAAVIKYMSNIAKVFAMAGALFLTSFISSFVLHFVLPTSFFLGLVNVSFSIFLYRERSLVNSNAGSTDTAVVVAGSTTRVRRARNGAKQSQQPYTAVPAVPMTSLPAHAEEDDSSSSPQGEYY